MREIDSEREGERKGERLADRHRIRQPESHEGTDWRRRADMRSYRSTSSQVGAQARTRKVRPDFRGVGAGAGAAAAAAHGRARRRRRRRAAGGRGRGDAGLRRCLLGDAPLVGLRDPFKFPVCVYACVRVCSFLCARACAVRACLCVCVCSLIFVCACVCVCVCVCVCLLGDAPLVSLRGPFRVCLPVSVCVCLHRS